MIKYNHKLIEKKWQKVWDNKKLYFVDQNSDKDKRYVLSEFPFPSGEGLHMGHLRPYVAGDVFARYQRMNGKNTLYPMGWDAFGLPSENFAIKRGVHPKISTEKNIKNAKRQLKSWGIGFDWGREINTTDPLYYKWTQWIFLQFLKDGLAYEATGLINWCPKDKTGLANEEVIDGKCERCGTPVEKKELRQWYLKITAYAEKLLAGLKNLNWPNEIKVQQENWIGKSEGSQIKFDLVGIPGQADKKHFVEVFTTRPDTLFGATFLVVSPELAKKWVDVGWKAEANVQNYINKSLLREEQQRMAEEKEKTGVFSGIYANNPATKEEIPVWVADYVLGSYGTGAIMAVPAHDQRDFEFAKKFNLPIRQVIEPVLVQTGDSSAFRPNEPVQDSNGIIVLVKHWKDDKYLGLKWTEAADWGTLLTGGIDDGMSAEETVLKELREETGYKNAKIIQRLGIIHGKYYHVPKKLNRFGHAPVFVVQLQNGERDQVSAEEMTKHEILWLTPSQLRNFLTPFSHQTALELFLSGVYTGYGLLTNSNQFNGMDSNEARKKITEFVDGKTKVQYKLRDWAFSRQRYWGEPIPVIHCAKCGVVPVPEKDLPVKLPNVKKYQSTCTGESPLAAIDKWVNVKCPKCKIPAKRETNTMPQWAGSSWYYLRYADPKNKNKFADPKKLKYWLPVDVYFGGREHTTLHLLYSRFWHLFLYDKKLVPTSEPYAKRIPHGIILGPDGEKMSKSRGNVVNPDNVVKSFGADTLRMYEMFLGPHEATVAWKTEGIVGIKRFLDRVWKLYTSTNNESNTNIRITQKSIKKITEDIMNFRFNTAISQLMILLNELEKNGPNTIFLKLLAPFAPHLTEEIWQNILGNKKSIHLEKWPNYDEKFIIDDEFDLVVQINGKVKDKFKASVKMSKEEIEIMALSRPKVKNAIVGKTVIKSIFVPKRLINFVV